MLKREEPERVGFARLEMSNGPMGGKKNKDSLAVHGLFRVIEGWRLVGAMTKPRSLRDH